jgi:hypothetical protein
MSWTSRKRRKRNRRRLAEQAEWGGDRQEPLISPGGSGANRPDWSDATRGELVLLAHAIRTDWPIPVHRRRPILKALLSIFSKRHWDCRLALAVARVVIAADKKNVESRG